MRWPTQLAGNSTKKAMVAVYGASREYNLRVYELLR